MKFILVVAMLAFVLPAYAENGPSGGCYLRQCGSPPTLPPTPAEQAKDVAEVRAKCKADPSWSLVCKYGYGP